jgi:hypothetical protein
LTPIKSEEIVVSVVVLMLPRQDVLSVLLVVLLMYLSPIITVDAGGVLTHQRHQRHQRLHVPLAADALL